jgi:hypothetical protein
MLGRPYGKAEDTAGLQYMFSKPYGTGQEQLGKVKEEE